MISKILKNKTVKNVSWILFGKIAQMLISLIVGLLTARYLGPSNYGLVNYAAAYVAFFSAFCTLGINSLLVKEFIDSPEDEGKIIGTVLLLKAIASFLSCLMIICIVCIVDKGEQTTIIVVALSSIGMIFHIFDTFNYWFQAKLQSKVTAMTTLIAYIVTSGYKILLMINDKDVTFFAFATSIDYICIGILLLIMYRKYQGKNLKISLAYGKKILGKSKYFILPGLMVAIYGQTDKLMLKHLISDAEIGFYSTAVSICNIWCFLLNAIIDSAYPSIMQANNVNQRLFIKRNKQLYAIVFYLAMIVALGFTIFSKEIIVIMYGEAYLPAVRPLRIIVWYTAFSYLGVARNAWIVCKERQKYLIYIYIASAALNVILNIFLIPSYGSVGAAVASLVAQISTTMIVPFFVKDLRENVKMMIEAIGLKGIK